MSDQDSSEKPIEKEPRIKITPLYTPDLENRQQAQTPSEDINQANNTQENPPQKPTARALILPAEWILESSMESAPELLKGIFCYLQSRSHCMDESQLSVAIPSCHRFILVGPPGSGKTTLAHAMAHMLGYSIVFVPATGLLGRFRNETAKNIQNLLREQNNDEKTISVRTINNEQSQTTDILKRLPLFGLPLMT